MKQTGVYDCAVLPLDTRRMRQGNISIAQNAMSAPFDVQRVFYLYDIPGGESRGGHTHRQLQQFIIAASGVFSVTLDDGLARRTFQLDRPYQGLLVVPGIWAELSGFSSGSVCLVLASDVYDESDYIRDYNQFINYKK